MKSSGPCRAAQGRPFHARWRQATPARRNGALLARGKPVPYQAQPPPVTSTGDTLGSLPKTAACLFPLAGRGGPWCQTWADKGDAKGRGAGKRRNAPPREQPRGQNALKDAQGASHAPRASVRFPGPLFWWFGCREKLAACQHAARRAGGVGLATTARLCVPERRQAGSLTDGAEWLNTGRGDVTGYGHYVRG